MRLHTILLSIIVTLSFGAVGLHLLGNARTFQLFGDIVARIDTDAPLVAITFDDGPTAEHTGSVLDILAAHGVTATFFLTGREIEENLQQAVAIAEAGHEIGNHTWSHRRMIFTSPATVREEIERTDAAIRAAGYEGEIHFRPPYGKKLVTLPWYLAQNNRSTIMWDIEPESDAALVGDPRAMADYVVENVTDGSIVLMHVMYGSRQTSRQALPAIIEGLQARGFRFVTVSDLMAVR